MAKKANEIDDFEDDADGEFEDFDYAELKLTELSNHFTARRRLEQLREERELDRMLNSSYDYSY